MQNSTRGNGPPLGNREISRAGEVHRSGIVKSHALEWPSTQKSQKPTRRRGPPLGKCWIPRAGEVPRSGIAEFHAQERSTTQKMQNLTRGNDPAPKNRIFSRASSAFLL